MKPVYRHLVESVHFRRGRVACICGWTATVAPDPDAVAAAFAAHRRELGLGGSRNGWPVLPTGEGRSWT